MNKTKFAGNGLSRTAMIFRIATVSGHNLIAPELNRVKTLNPRGLERVYDHVTNSGSRDDAIFALSLLLN